MLHYSEKMHWWKGSTNQLELELEMIINIIKGEGNLLILD